MSQVDRLWTFLPVIYSTHFTFWPKWSGTGHVDDRMFLVWILQLLWSARLTTNTYRRGFFNPKSEDYRWEYVRQRIPKWQFSLSLSLFLASSRSGRADKRTVNLVFVAFIQNYLLLFVELPQYLLLQAHNAFGARNPKLGPEDYLLAFVFVTILVFEMIADNQQQAYQHLKQNAQSLKKKDKHKGDLMSAEQQGRITRGFVTEGLWSWSRHPNFALEQSTWWVMYLFTVIPYLPTSGLTVDAVRKSVERISSPSDLLALIRGTEGLLWNYSIWGPIAMSLLFYSSTMLTEEISAGKYPLYKQYQRRVGFFWPPITIAKGIWLSITGQKQEVDDAVFGTASSQVAKKNK